MGESAVQKRPFTLTPQYLTASSLVWQFKLDDFINEQNGIQCSGLCFNAATRTCSCGDGVQINRLLSRVTRMQLLGLVNSMMAATDLLAAGMCGVVDPILVSKTHACPPE